MNTLCEARGETRGETRGEAKSNSTCVFTQ